MAIPPNFPIFAQLPAGQAPLALFDQAFAMILNGQAPVPIGEIDVGATIVGGGGGNILFDNAGKLGALASTGNGLVVRQNAASIINANLNTPSAINLTNGTALPVATGISGLGAGVAAWLAVPSSANLLAAMTTGTGTGLLVFNNTPTLASAVNTGSPTAPTQAASDNSTKLATTAYVDRVTGHATTGAFGVVQLGTLAQTLARAPAGLVPTIENLFYPTNYISGLTLSNNVGTPASKLDVAAGVARDSTDVNDLQLAAAITGKDITVAWAVGSNAGMLDTGAIANNTYHIFLIKRPDTGVVDVLASLSPSAPTLPANYTLFRRIASIVRIAAALQVFTQLGNQFLLKTPVMDFNGSPGVTTAVTRTLANIPTGIQVLALLTVATGESASSNSSGYISSLDQTDVASSTPSIFNYGSAGSNISLTFPNAQIRTNTSAQVRTRNQSASGSSILSLITNGWIDTRGQ